MGSLAPPGYNDLLTAALDPFLLAPLRCLALAYVNQDFGEIERSTIKESKDIGIKYDEYICVFLFFTQIMSRILFNRIGK